MTPSDYLITFYSVIAGLTATIYIQKWGELLQQRRYVLYVTVPLLWSFCFFNLVVYEWFTHFKWEATTNSFMFLMALSVPFLLYGIGMLLFPTTDMLDRKDKYAYLDYYEHFRQNKTWIMSFGLFIFAIKFFSAWFYNTEGIGFFDGLWQFLCFKRNYLAIVALLIALFTEHKGQMLVLGLVLFYVWLSTWAYVSI